MYSRILHTRMKLALSDSTMLVTHRRNEIEETHAKYLSIKVTQRQSRFANAWVCTNLLRTAT